MLCATWLGRHLGWRAQFEGAMPCASRSQSQALGSGKQEPASWKRKVGGAVVGSVNVENNELGFLGLILPLTTMGLKQGTSPL